MAVDLAQVHRAPLGCGQPLYPTDGEGCTCTCSHCEQTLAACTCTCLHCSRSLHHACACDRPLMPHPPRSRPALPPDTTQHPPQKGQRP